MKSAGNGRKAPADSPHSAAEAEMLANIATLTRLRTLLDEEIEAGGLSPKRVSMAGVLSNRIGLLTAEIRKGDAYVKKAVGAMTVAEKVELVLSFIDELPEAQRDVVRKHVSS